MPTMTEVLQSPRFSSSSPGSSPFYPLDNGNGGDLGQIHHTHLSSPANFLVGGQNLDERVAEEVAEEAVVEEDGGDTLSLLALLVAAFRKSMVPCNTDKEDVSSMDIGWPTDVRHVAHVTFDRFNGFLGLPDEFEPDVPRRAPSASASVFGVSTESMQCSYDTRGNSVPTILLQMQRKLYAQGGLQAEGIFRINAENSQEEYLRDQLNKGIVPDNIDVHCLSGLIKAWFRELPKGVLDSLTPEQVMQANTEEDCLQLVRLLPSTEAALLDWAINLMADVVQEEHINKMNARNVAMVFAPNMTQMADPLSALMYAVQVMNFLKTLILKTLRERQDSVLQAAPSSQSDPSDENDKHTSSQCCLSISTKEEQEQQEHIFPTTDPNNQSLIDDVGDGSEPHEDKSSTDCCSKPTATESPSEEPSQSTRLSDGPKVAATSSKTSTKDSHGNKNNSNAKKVAKKTNVQNTDQATVPAEKSRGMSIVSHISSSLARVEAWR
ncbi:rho GTPase-activating protein 5-like [Nymphaea colorata]|nr:rho GTPase-activating protein 5-like [Nymphaea colorata]